MGEAIQGWLQAVGIRTRMRTMERAAFMTAWREKKLHGVVLTISGRLGQRGDPARVVRHRATAPSPTARCPRSTTSSGARRRELDKKKREALLHQMQRIIHDQVTQAPIYHLGFPTGLGPRVEDILATAIPGFYMSPYEDLKLKRP